MTQAESHSAKRAARGAAGFSLTELLVVVTIVAILATVAYPGYQAQVQSGRRSDAKAELMRLAQYMERVYTEAGCYDAGADMTCGSGSPIATDGDGKMTVDAEGYDFTFSAGPTASGYTIRATPIEDGVQDGDGFLQINELGERTWDENDSDAIDTDAGENDWERG